MQWNPGSLRFFFLCSILKKGEWNSNRKRENAKTVHASKLAKKENILKNAGQMHRTWRIAVKNPGMLKNPVIQKALGREQWAIHFRNWPSLSSNSVNQNPRVADSQETCHDGNYKRQCSILKNLNIIDAKSKISATKCWELNWHSRKLTSIIFTSKQFFFRKTKLKGFID